MTNDLETATAKVPANPSDFDPYAAYVAATASGGAFLKYVRGVFQYGADDEELSLQTRLAPNMGELAYGHIKWVDALPKETTMIRAVDGPPPKREELGDTDKSKWDQGPNGELIDPWTETHNLPFRDPATGQEFTFTTSSRGGIGALNKLISQWHWQGRKHPDKMPIIKLNSGSYKHKTYGIVHVPSFPIVDWLTEAELMDGNTASDIHEDLNDSVPF